ncbi:ATP-binding protein [Fimbriiglobus ruber]|uniref:Orc1-like AAA ATPase domain-containing protein n=1 Tax=Fimbriiglobus ruber TaxID=1908690 RepID=A0A225DZG2_9BACT|nr:ATP-binding protein [Fimbriiglobus ruber]OWK46692.1 hypothetical protein FRUB_00391 [Fimbriiglobus ruber]
MTAPNAELLRLEVLRAFKRRMPRSDLNANISPFDDRVTTAQGVVAQYDITDIHAAVRGRIRETIEAVRDGRKKSQVILLTGDVGTGKTHLLRTFQDSDQATAVGYVFAGGSNHWKIEEFQARLLDWVIEALTAPTPSENHLLLERVRAIGFCAVDQLLTNPTAWRSHLAKSGNRWLGWLTRRFRAPTHESLKKRADARDPTIFAAFDFATFSTYVCDRFLAERSNPTHRFALRVLLTYLFPDRHETGVGTRERVLHWFRNRGDEEYFARRLGASERIDQTFKVMEAVKLLTHLFSPAVSSQLSTPAHPCPPRVFVLVFDQSEGRNELFDGEQDWRDFFAHLSELYNTLPNIVALFTMTLIMRDKLHGNMERQFRDRIRMDESFTLRFPDEGQVLNLYQTRLTNWLRDDPILLDHYNQLDNPYVPFTRSEVLEIVGNTTVRESLERLDTRFRRTLVDDVVVDVKIDFETARNHYLVEEKNQNEWDYTANHLETVSRLFDSVRELLSRDNGIGLANFDSLSVCDVPILKVTVESLNRNEQVYIYLGRVGKRYNDPVIELIRETLFNRKKSQYFLFVVRPVVMNLTVSDPYKTQVLTGVCDTATETSLRALHHVAKTRDMYADPGEEKAFRELLQGIVGRSYLGELLRHARTQLTTLAQSGSGEAPGPSTD